jgi:shikimate dehydrogenase
VSAPFAAPIDASTRYCAVFGHPVRHSASPAMHNAAMGVLGLNWRYLAYDVDPARLREAIVGAATMGFVGLNLTVPHKLLAVELVDELDRAAREWGAVNTVRFEGEAAKGVWKPVWEFTEAPQQVRSVGFNTDADAIIRSLEEDLGFTAKGKRVLLLGAGGAGRVAALRLAAAGVSELFLLNRTRSKAVEVAREVQSRFPQVKTDTDYPQGPVDLLLNATSLGLRSDDALPVDRSKFRLEKAGAVYDMIYRPAETALLKEAKAAGCRAANGLGMLLYQGAGALELWTGQKPPITVMRDALVRNVYGTSG